MPSKETETREGFYLSEDGEWIPDGWEVIPAEEYCIKVADGTHDSPKQAEKGFLLATSKNIKNGRLDLGTAYFISEKDYQEINRRSAVSRWDVLYSMIGTVGESCLIIKKPTFAIKNVGLFKNKSQNEGKWLAYFLQSPQAFAYLQSRLSGTTQKYITLGNLRRFPIYKPRPEEQRVIVNILSSLDDKIELLREQNETLEAMAQTLFKRWFIDFNFPDKNGNPYKDSGGKMIPSELGEIPEGWKVGTLEDTVGLNKHSWNAKNKPDIVEYVDLANTKNGVINETIHYVYDEAPSRAKRILNYFDTIIGTVRPGNRSFALVGKSGYTGSTGFAVCSPLKHYYKEFNYLSLTKKESFERLEFLADGSAYPAVNPSIVISERRPVAQDAIFTKFSELSEPLFKEILSNLEQAETLTKLRNTLLPKLMKGEIRIEL